MLGFNIVTGLPDVRLTVSQAVNTWFALTKRSLTFNKSSATSKLRVTYQDTLGARATFYNSCEWRFVLDQTPLSLFSDGDLEGSYGWRMHNGTHTAWAFDIPTGQHEVHVEMLRMQNATDCLAGWNNTLGNFFSVEEIP
jgi:hypothetical protein